MKKLYRVSDPSFVAYVEARTLEQAASLWTAKGGAEPSHIERIWDKPVVREEPT